ncbi:MAG: Uma2 family endonuclease, partial [Actinomycetota bacterium]
PSPTASHQIAAARVWAVLDAAVPEGVGATPAWSWYVGGDEFIPDVVLHDETAEDVRLTAVPHLAVEVLSTDRAADTLRKFAKYEAAGLSRYWIVDLDDRSGPEIVTYELREGSYVETGRYTGDTKATLDAGPMTITVRPNDLVK